jgi:hypothetical protein
MSIVLMGSTSGSCTLSEQAVAGTTTLTLPTITGTVGILVSGTAVASTSGTSIDFTGIPAGIRRITVMINGVSTNGTSNILLQLGDSGGVENTGYATSVSSISTTANTTNGSNSITAGFPFYNTSIGASDTLTATIVLLNLTGNTWLGNGSGIQGTRTIINAGSKDLSATLDRVRLTTTNGTDTFDAGTINILYE